MECSDVNECNLGTDTCTVGQECENNPGSFTCNELQESNPTVDPDMVHATVFAGLGPEQTFHPFILNPDEQPGFSFLGGFPTPGLDCEDFLVNVNSFPIENVPPLEWEWVFGILDGSASGSYTCTAIWLFDYDTSSGIVSIERSQFLSVDVVTED